MNQVSWITRLSEKKPSPALVAALLIAVSTLAGVSGYQYRESKSIRLEYDEKIEKERLVCDKEKAELKIYLIACQNENREWANSTIKRLDADAEKREQEYKKRIDRFEKLETRHAKLRAERTSLINQNGSKIQTLKSTSDEND